jgi:hypothetical protein
MSDKQPAYALLKSRGYTVATAAQAIGANYVHLRDALNSRVRPRPEVVAELRHLLGVKRDTDLFTKEILAKPHNPRIDRNRRHRALKATVAA